MNLDTATYLLSMVVLEITQHEVRASAPQSEPKLRPIKQRHHAK